MRMGPTSTFMSLGRCESGVLVHEGLAVFAAHCKDFVGRGVEHLAPVGCLVFCRVDANVERSRHGGHSIFVDGPVGESPLAQVLVVHRRRGVRRLRQVDHLGLVFGVRLHQRHGVLSIGVAHEHLRGPISEAHVAAACGRVALDPEVDVHGHVEESDVGGRRMHALNTLILDFDDVVVVRP